MKRGNKLLSAASAAAVSMTALLGVLPAQTATWTAYAAASYPVQEFRLGMADTDNNVTASGAGIIPTELAGVTEEKWSLNFVSDGVYEIVSSSNGYILTANGSGVSLAADTDGANQRWKIEGAEKDFEGNYLYYKITSNADASKSLTYTDGSGFTLKAYSGETYQKYKLNLDGLEGYAANAKVAGGEKAGTIGGLLGDTVYVSTVEDMIAAMKSTEPLTIVVSANLDFKDWPKTDQKIEDDKTIVGSYAANEVYDLQWRTDDFYGSADLPPSNNIVIRNISVTSRTLRGIVMIQVYSSRNVWFDHCSFYNTISYDRTGDGLDEVGKFIWINTPSMGWTDDAYNGISPDYITISYCEFHDRYWTVAYGTQNTETTRDRTTLLYNSWEQCVRRTPQIGNGTMHIYNNYFEGYGDGSNGSGTAQIIGGDGSDILSENNRFQGFSLREALSMGGGSDPAKDSGSYLSTSTSGTPSTISFSPKVTSTLNPGASLYGYSLLNAYASNGNDTKKFAQTYAGCFSNAGGIKYITDADMAGWIAVKYPTPFLRHVELKTKAGATFDTSVNYTIQNVNSGLYLEVADGAASSGANVQQGKSADKTAYTWRLEDAGDGYYYIYTALGDLCIDLPYASTDNGTSIGLWSNDESDARKFKFVDNGDGSYTITTKCTSDASCFGVISDSKENGADVIQWICNGGDSQKWYVNVRPEPISGTLFRSVEILDTTYYQAWKINSSIALGDAVFGDRSAESAAFSEIPATLIGAEAIMTACDAKNLNTDLAEITAGANITAYIALDSRVETPAAWLNDWSKTELTIQTSNDVTFELYAREMKAGETVTIGTNGQSASCMNYFVLAVETGSNVTLGDLSENGKVDTADLVMMQKYLLTQETLTEAQYASADMNGDGKVNAIDLTLLKRILLN